MASNNTNLDVNVNINDEEVPKSEERFRSLKAQIRETTRQLQELTDKGETQGKKFSELNLKLAELRTEAEQVNNKTQSLTATFGLMGGVVGEFSEKAEIGITALKTISSFTLQDIKNQFMVVGQELKTFALKIVDAAGFTKAYAAMNAYLAESFVAVGIGEEAAATGAKAFSAAIVATGIGALLIGLVALAANWDKVTEALEGTTEEEMAFAEAQSKVTKGVEDFYKKLNDVKFALKSAEEGTMSKKEALKEYNDKLGATVGYAKSLGEAEDLLSKNTPIVVKGIQLRAQAQVMYAKAAEASAKLVSGEGLEQGFWEKTWAFVKNFGDVTDAAIERVSEFTDENTKASKVLSAEGDKLTNEAIENDKKLVGSRTKPTDPKKDPRVAQEAAVQAEINKVVEANYESTLEARDKELYAAGAKYNDLLVKAKKYHIDTTALTEGFRMQEASINKKYDDEEAKKEKERQEKNAKLILDFEIKLAADLQKIEDKKKEDKIKSLDDDIKLLQAQEASLLKGSIAYFNVAKEIEDKSYEERKLKAEGNAKALEEIEKTHKNNKINIKIQEMEAEKQIQLETVDMYASIGGLLGQIAGKNKELAIAALLIEKAAAVAKVVISTNAAIAEYSLQSLAFGPVAGPIAATAYATKQHISEAINIASIVAAAAIGVAGISSSGGGGAEVSAPNKNSTAGKQGYGDGGLLEGPRHAQGGVMINAEGGEAVMTRGAVTMFGPMLSMMNQAGGGTAFNKSVSGMARYDNPKSPSNPSMEQQVIKTYVVANELNTMQHKQARLKDLSTL